MNRNLKHWIVLAVSVAAGGLAAQTLDLSKPPLFLNGAVDPNLMVTFDDSGSMAWGYTPDNVDDGDCDWRYKRFYSPAFNRQYFNPAINYEPPLRADGSRMPDQSYTAALINGFNGSATTVNLSNAYFGDNVYGLRAASHNVSRGLLQVALEEPRAGHFGQVGEGGDDARLAAPVIVQAAGG